MLNFVLEICIVSSLRERMVEYQLLNMGCGFKKKIIKCQNVSTVQPYV